MTESLRIGEVAELCEVSVDTIRHYERKKLLPPISRGSGGYREYPPAAVRRIQIIRRALSIGFSLDELAAIFRQRTQKEAPCRRVHELAKDKLEALDRRIEELRIARAALASRIEEWDRRLEREGQRPAYLLESLID